MNENNDTNFPAKNTGSSLGAELEARIVAWIAGEASAFEAAELERLAAEKPEVAAFKREIETAHALAAEAVKPDPAPLRMSEKRRAKLLAALGAKIAAKTEAQSSETEIAAFPQKKARSWTPYIWVGSSVAACLFVAYSIPHFGIVRPVRPDPMPTSIAAADRETDQRARFVNNARQLPTVAVETPAVGADERAYKAVPEARLEEVRQKALADTIKPTAPQTVATIVEQNAPAAASDSDARTIASAGSHLSSRDSINLSLLPTSGSLPTYGSTAAAERQSIGNRMSFSDNGGGIAPALALSAPTASLDLSTVANAPSSKLAIKEAAGVNLGATGSAGVISQVQNSGTGSVTFSVPRGATDPSAALATGSAQMTKQNLLFGVASATGAQAPLTATSTAGGTVVQAKTEAPVTQTLLGPVGGAGSATTPISPIPLGNQFAAENIRGITPAGGSTLARATKREPSFEALTANSTDLSGAISLSSTTPPPPAGAARNFGTVTGGIESAAASAKSAPRELSQALARVAEEKKKAATSEETAAAREAVSTFSLHVSDVSFHLLQSHLAATERGENPAPPQLRAEEIYNAFDYDDPAPSEREKVAARIEQSAHPMLQQRNLVRIALRVAATGRAASQPLRLTILLDTSGSMEREDRRAAVRRAMAELVALLGPQDRITLIGFARQPRLLAVDVQGNQAGELVALAASTPPDGGTNLEAALQLAREQALRHRQPGAQNRIVLLTDGAANLGDADPARLTAMVETLRQEGIAFDACGVGLEGTGDTTLEALTRKGDGRYYVLDRPETADATFARKLAGAFRPAAENVKLQVRFNPARVGNYRLIGFEKHRLREEDFRNDRVDAAELSAEEAAVALYQVEPLPQGTGELGEVTVRFRDPATGEVIERSWPILYEATAPAFDRASPSMQLAGVAAMVAEVATGSTVGEQVRFNELAPVVTALRGHFPQQARVQELTTVFNQLRRSKRD